MEINHCPNCMEKITSYPCPHCGFDGVEVSRTEYALPCGTILHGRYLVGRVLGQGGFGLTYVGFDLALQVKCAIKEYYPNGQVTREPGGTMLYWYTTPQAEDLRRAGMATFLKEARKMAKVAEVPQVVSVRDTFAANATAYIIMDFAEGRTLKSCLMEEGPLSWEEAETIFTPVIAAMGQVHEAGIIHRDLSPDNLMLLPDGSVKILDLGAAKDLTVNSGVSSMQVVKSGFSPIEQYSRAGFSGPRTDVYAMAATMYYSLTGKLPPAAVDRLDEDCMNWDLPQLKEIPPSALQALKNAMEVSAQERTQSMAELLKELQGNASIQGKKKKKDPKTRRRAWIMALLIPAALALSVGAWAYFGYHVWLPAECEKPETCSICGMTRGDAPGHSWTEADCENGQICTVCGKQGEQALGHDWTESTCAELSRCTRCGQKTGELAPHTLTGATVSAPPRCTVCGLMDGYPLGNTIAAGDQVSLAVKDTWTKGTVLGGGFATGVGEWRDIVAVSADAAEAGLTADGRVLVAGNVGTYTHLQMMDWTDVVAVATGGWSVVGVRSDGTVLTTMSEGADVSTWTDIVAVDASVEYIVGLKADGTVVATGRNNVDERTEARSWTNIVGVAAGENFTLGMRPDGTVVVAGTNPQVKEAVEKWTDIVAIAAAGYDAVGLKSDGTVVYVDAYEPSSLNFEDWTDIVSISASSSHVLGLKADGTVVATGRWTYGQYGVGAARDWAGVSLPE